MAIFLSQQLDDLPFTYFTISSASDGVAAFVIYITPFGDKLSDNHYISY